MLSVIAKLYNVFLVISTIFYRIISCQNACKRAMNSTFSILAFIINQFRKDMSDIGHNTTFRIISCHIRSWEVWSRTALLSLDILEGKLQYFNIPSYEAHRLHCNIGLLIRSLTPLTQICSCRLFDFLSFQNYICDTITALVKYNYLTNVCIVAMVRSMESKNDTKRSIGGV